jgi:hypothetical protein
MVPLTFFIDIILPAALWLWCRLSLLTEMSTSDISRRLKAAGEYGWQPYYLHVPFVLKSGSLSLLEPSGPVQACNGIALPYDIVRRRMNIFRTQSIFNFSMNAILL